MGEARRPVLLWVLGGLALLSLLGIAVSGAVITGYRPGGTSAPGPLVGRPVPDLTLPVVAGDGAGDRVALRDLRGEVVLLDFWAGWCRPCRRSIPVLNRVHARLGDRVRMFGINVESGEPAANVRRSHRSFGARFPSLQDERLAAQTAFAVEGIPTLVLVDREGTIRWTGRGVPREGEVVARAEELLDDDR